MLYLIFIVLLFNKHGEAASRIGFDLPNSIAYTGITILLIFLELVIWDRIIVDKVSQMLFLRCIIVVIAIIINAKQIGKISILMTIVIQLLIYNFVYNNFIEFKAIIKLLKWVFIIICVQSVSLGFGDLIRGSYVKTEFIIPIGGSNYIGSILNTLFIVILLNENNINKCVLYLVGWLIAIITTQSASTIIMGCVFLVFYFVVFLRNDKVKRLKLTFLFLAFIVFFAIVIWSTLEYQFSIFFNRFITIFNNVSLNNITKLELDKIFNKRVSITIKALELIKANWVIGYGTNYELFLGSNSHNFLTDAMLVGGVLNLISLLVIFSIIFRRLYRNYHLISNKTALVVTVSSLLQGLIEPNFQGFSFSIIYFIIIAVAMKEGAIYEKANSFYPSRSSGKAMWGT